MTATLELLDSQYKTNSQREKEFSTKFLNRVHQAITDEKIFEYTQKQKTLYHQTFTGMQVGKHKGELLIFWTLTTRYERGQQKKALLAAETELNKHFVIWKKRVCRHIQQLQFIKWFKQNYPDTDLSTAGGRREYRKIKNHPYKTHGPQNDPEGIWRPWYHNFRYKMCYIKVRTTEGGGVIHGLLRKSPQIPMLDFNFLQNAWKQIHHNSHRIEIHEVKDRSEGLQGARETAYYLCGSYFNQQPIARKSASYNWIFQGALGRWKKTRPITGPKKYITTYVPWTAENEHEQTIRGTFTHKTPNVVIKRPGIIQAFMNTRKSLRKDSGYENALYEWLKLTRHPPPQTRQLKIHDHQWQITAAQGISETAFLVFKHCPSCNKWSVKEKVYNFAVN